MSGTQRILQLLGLGALTSAADRLRAVRRDGGAWPRFVLLLRTASVTRQRHGRRRLIRGRPRWYDVPKTTLAMPGYLLLALFGALVLVLVAGLARSGACSRRPTCSPSPSRRGWCWRVGLHRRALVGAGIRAPARGHPRRGDTHGRSTELGGWFVVAMCLLATAVLVALLLDAGPNWTPALSAPWA